MNFDTRFSLASLTVGLTSCSILLGLITLAPQSFWDALAKLGLMLALLLGLAGVILIASVLFIAAVLLTGYAAVLLLGAIGRRVAWSG